MNEFIARNGIIAQSNSTITGSLTVTNGITGSISGTATSASYAVSASQAASAISASFASNATSASFAASAATASYFLTSSVSSASFATSASYAATSSYASDFNVANTLTATTLVVQTVSSSVVYSSGSNVFGNDLSNTQVMTGSVSITGSFRSTGPMTVSGSAIVTGSLTALSLIKVGGTSSQYLMADGSTSLFPDLSSSIRSEQTYTATSGQTTFTVTGGYVVGLVDVYVNGVKYAPDDYTATNGTTVVLATGVVTGDIVDIINYKATIAALPTSRDVFDYTATAGQTTFTVSGGYVVGLLDVYVNGVKLTSSEYTATNGTTFVLAVASVLDDEVQAIRYNASVNGVSGAGTTNYIPKFTASQTIGDSAITDDGTTVILNSRVLSGSSAVFTGNVGIGSTLSSWGSTFSISQYPYGTYVGGTTTGGTVFGNNNYYNGTNYIYSNSDYASQYQQASGEHFWRTASTGTQGGTVTFSERMRITNAGNVGIGTASPAVTLHIDASGGGIVRATRLGAGSAYIQLEADGSNGTLTSSTALLMNAGGSERMRITSAGLIGIGTTAPYSKLTIHSTASSTLGLNAQSGLVLGQGGVTNDLVQIGFNQAVSSTYSPAAISYLITNQGASTLGDILFSTRTSISDVAPSERMRITSSGYVGIGTSSPSNLLQLNAAIATSSDAGFLTIKQSSQTYTNGIYIERSGERNGHYIYVGGSVDSLIFRRNYFGTQGDTMSLTRDGNVGIGTTSPNSFLDVQGANAKPSGASTSYWHSAIIDTTSATTGVGGGLQFMGYKTGTSAFAFFGAIAGIKENSTAGNEQGALVFYSSVSAASGLTEKMRITSGGNVGIGTTGPSTNLDIRGTTPTGIKYTDNDTYTSYTRSYYVQFSGTYDITTERTDGGSWEAMLMISSVLVASGAHWNVYTIALGGRATSITQSQLHNNSGGTASRTAISVSSPSNGVIRLTLTGGENCNVKITLFALNGV